MPASALALPLPQVGQDEIVEALGVDVVEYVSKFPAGWMDPIDDDALQFPPPLVVRILTYRRGCPGADLGFFTFLGADVGFGFGFGLRDVVGFGLRDVVGFGFDFDGEDGISVLLADFFFRGT